MSNKTQLQTNNTELSSLIEAIRDKAAGSGSSGGGSIETCVVAVETDGPSAPGFSGPSFYYTDENMSLKFIETGSGAFTVAKNTIIVINGWSGSSGVVNGSSEQIFYSAGYAAYKITGDCTLSYMG